MNWSLKPILGSLVIGLLPLSIWAGPVDINQADAETLAAELDGIGLSRAEAIVKDRTLNGPFASVEDLTRVKGVGSRIIDVNRQNIVIGSKR